MKVMRLFLLLSFFFASSVIAGPIQMSSKTNLTASVDPTADDDSTLSYEAGSVWFNVAAVPAPSIWLCTNATAGSAIWIDVTTSPIGQSLQASYNAGYRIVVGANGLRLYSVNTITRSLRICNGADDTGCTAGFYLYVEGGVPKIQAFPDSNNLRNGPAAFGLIDTLDGVDCRDTASTGVHTYANTCRPTISAYIPADRFLVKGTCTTNSNVLLGPAGSDSWPTTLDCTDADADGFSFTIPTPKGFDTTGDKIVALDFVDKNVTPAGIYEFDCSLRSTRSGDAFAALATTSEQPATVSFAAAARYTRLVDDTPAITIQGTGGSEAMLTVNCEVDAIATTISGANLPEVHILGAFLKVKRNKRSDQ